MRSEAAAWAIALFMGGLFMTGCASTNPTVDMTEANVNTRTSVYSTLDSTALVYTAPAAGSPADDNPWRWAGFLLNPVGVGLDYAVNRPIYTLGSHFPRAMGYTAEDAMLDSYRQK